MYGCFDLMYVCVPHVHSDHKGQKRATDLEGGMVGEIQVLKYSIISPASTFIIFIIYFYHF